MRFALTALLSAALLFLVQPLMGRLLLPWFGGGAAVWTLCLLFFQVALLLGYAYAHLLALRLPPKRGAITHGALVALSLLSLPLGASPPSSDTPPTLGVLLTLTGAVLAPYLTLSATAPLVQAWAARVEEGREPYRLYAWSNAGSLAALLAYPLLLEPWVGLRRQLLGWSAGYLAFAGLMGACAWWASRAQGRAARPIDEAVAAPRRGDYALWITLTAVASALLLAVTDQLTEDISVHPLLWVTPLGLYLLTFIISFGRPSLAARGAWFGLLPLTGVALWWCLGEGAELGALGQFAILNGALLVGAMALHGEVARLRPAPRHLTGFYLATALGGALGGVSVGLVAPMIFPARVELQLATLATGLLASRQAWRAWRARPFASTSPAVGALMPLMVLVLAVGFGLQFHKRMRRALVIDRGFYGSLWVKEIPSRYATGPARELVHGRIMHGQQYTDERRSRALAYYGEDSGLGRFFAQRASGGPRSVAVVGLGVGTLAAYGRPGDRIVFYEIDPLVLRFAEAHFTYLLDARARGVEVEVRVADGRRGLSADEGVYDVLVLDAFSSDVIPAHLLTREAFEVYTRRLRPDGVLMVNVANRHVDLLPVLRLQARALGLSGVEVARRGVWREGTAHTQWAVMARPGEGFIEGLVEAGLASGDMALPGGVAWTDDFAPLLPLLKALR